MAKRVLVWCAVVAGVGSVVALGIVFASAGLDRADKMASVFGAFIGIGGLAVAVHGLRVARRGDDAAGFRNSISGVVHGPVVQARDVRGRIEGPAPEGAERIWDENS
ncbi:hypothetical protein Acsp03_65130 [Actinomadura sp. NBRC 104412]|uniref:hypothetical protein n=1 Tax=Actinomadura sp. NBRC 104412 TaxID=3032203 RepID=UPI0024A38DE8|nr:hypothetical protein [Actinomadura sp. NBRC 104412]GLZ09047.1 hypothetical protein Acsp03_65130 [Actinomadura sp. NBRC 104412]